MSCARGEAPSNTSNLNSEALGQHSCQNDPPISSLSSKFKERSTRQHVKETGNFQLTCKNDNVLIRERERKKSDQKHKSMHTRFRAYKCAPRRPIYRSFTSTINPKATVWRAEGSGKLCVVLLLKYELFWKKLDWITHHRQVPTKQYRRVQVSILGNGMFSTGVCFHWQPYHYLVDGAHPAFPAVPCCQMAVNHTKETGSVWEKAADCKEKDGLTVVVRPEGDD